MNIANQHDSGADLVVACEGALASATITAAAGNDNVEIFGTAINRLLSGRRQHFSGIAIVKYSVTLAANKTFSLALRLQDAAVSNFASGAATVTATRIRHITSTGVVTDLTLTSGALAATVLRTDSGSGSTLTGYVQLDVDLGPARQYIRLAQTSDLNATGTDTSTIAGEFVFGGSDVSPTTV